MINGEQICYAVAIFHLQLKILRVSLLRQTTEQPSAALLDPRHLKHLQASPDKWWWWADKWLSLEWLVRREVAVAYDHLFAIFYNKKHKNNWVFFSNKTGINHSKEYT